MNGKPLNAKQSRLTSGLLYGLRFIRYKLVVFPFREKEPEWFSLLHITKLGIIPSSCIPLTANYPQYAIAPDKDRPRDGQFCHGAGRLYGQQYLIVGISPYGDKNSKVITYSKFHFPEMIVHTDDINAGR